MTEELIFCTMRPDFLFNLFNFTGDKNSAELKAIRIEPSGRYVALDGSDMGMFYEDRNSGGNLGTLPKEPISLFVTKEIRKNLKKAQWAKLYQKDRECELVITKKGNEKVALSIKCQINGSYPDLQPILNCLEKESQPVNEINMATESLEKYKFGKKDVLNLTFTGKESPIIVKNKSFEDEFLGFTMPVALED